MLQEINKWLTATPKERDYNAGLSFFNKFASDKMKKSYGDYLNSGSEEEVNTTDPRFNMLINKVTNIYSNMKIAPEAFANKLTPPTEEQAHWQLLQFKNTHSEVRQLKEEIKILQGSNQDKSAEIEGLEDELNEKEEQIETLKESLGKKGVTILTPNDLPDGLKNIYNSIQSLTPLIASLHADLTKDGITDEERKQLAHNICTYDDERRKYWDKIDTYIESKDSVFAEENNFQYSDDPVIRGMEMQNRINRLKENIKRSEQAAQQHTEKGKTNLVEKANLRAERYRKELAELEAITDATA